MASGEYINCISTYIYIYIGRTSTHLFDLDLNIDSENQRIHGGTSHV